MLEIKTLLILLLLITLKTKGKDGVFDQSFCIAPKPGN